MWISEERTRRKRVIDIRYGMRPTEKPEPPGLLSCPERLNGTRGVTKRERDGE